MGDFACNVNYNCQNCSKMRKNASFDAFFLRFANIYLHFCKKRIESSA